MLTYAADVKELASKKMSECNTALNDTIRKVATYNRWQSTREYRSDLGYLDLYTIYASFYSLYNGNTRPSNTVLMHLLYTKYVPMVTYAADVKELASKEMSECNTTLNDAIRKVVTYNPWQSIREYRSDLGYLDLYTIFARRQASFNTKLPSSNNALLRFLNEILTS